MWAWDQVPRSRTARAQYNCSTGLKATAAVYRELTNKAATFLRASYEITKTLTVPHCICVLPSERIYWKCCNYAEKREVHTCQLLECIYLYTSPVAMWTHSYGSWFSCEVFKGTAPAFLISGVSLSLAVAGWGELREARWWWFSRSSCFRATTSSHLTGVRLGTHKA